MFVRWQKRKRQRPALGYHGGEVRDDADRAVYNKRGSWLRTRRSADGSSLGQDIHWAAILAESTRVDGKPTQRHIAYLGGITDSALEHPAHRGYFWQEVMQRLDQLANRVLKDDRTRIEEAIAEKVPRLTRQEYDAWLVSRAEAEAEFGIERLSKMPSFEICGTPQTRRRK
jgi:hypothetical protein